MRHGYVARWRGADYEVSADISGARAHARLYRTQPADGFDEVAPGRYRRTVPLAEVERVAFVSEVCTWRGETFRVLARRGAELQLEYTGGEAPAAQRLGLTMIERGVYRVWVPNTEISDLRDEVRVLR